MFYLFIFFLKKKRTRGGIIWISWGTCDDNPLGIYSMGIGWYCIFVQVDEIVSIVWMIVIASSYNWWTKDRLNGLLWGTKGGIPDHRMYNWNIYCVRNVNIHLGILREEDWQEPIFTNNDSNIHWLANYEIHKLWCIDDSVYPYGESWSRIFSFINKVILRLDLSVQRISVYHVLWSSCFRVPTVYLKVQK